MVELDKLVQRSEALKRLRSLFDMHRVAFGSSGNLDDVVKALHHDRHFAMDFWGIVGGLCANEGAPLSEEDMFSAVVESATGVEPSALGKREQKAATQLRHLLAGIDIESPEAIERPPDELLDLPGDDHDGLPDSSQADIIAMEPRDANRFADVGFRTPPHENQATGEPVARRSLGETLARLEETSRELREQLQNLDEPTGQPQAAVDREAAAAAERADTLLSSLSSTMSGAVAAGVGEPEQEPVVEEATEPPAEIELGEAHSQFSTEPGSAARSQMPPVANDAQASSLEMASAEGNIAESDSRENIPLPFTAAAHDGDPSTAPEQAAAEAAMPELVVEQAGSHETPSSGPAEESARLEPLREPHQRAAVASPNTGAQPGSQRRPTGTGTPPRPPSGDSNVRRSAATSSSNSRTAKGAGTASVSGARPAAGSGTRQNTNAWRPPQSSNSGGDATAFSRRKASANAGRGGRSLASPRFDEEEAAITRERIRRMMGGDMSNFDDPRIPAPLADYGETEERSPARFAIVGLIIVAAAGGVIFGSRTATGHELMSRAGESFSGWWAQTRQHAAALKREATTPSVPFAADGNTGGGAAASAKPIQPATPASDSSAPPRSSNSSPEPAAPTTAAGTPPRSAAGATQLNEEPALGSGAARSNAPSLPPASPPMRSRSELAAEPNAGAPARSPAAPATAAAKDAAATTPPKRPLETASLAYGAAAPAHAMTIEATPEETRALLRTPMGSNLVSSRVPVYPIEARAEGVEGQVMMDVIITSSGLVRAVRVISGDPRLRSAAEESVMKWRYRPYLQNGHPIEVVTTVRVDFRLR